MHAATCISEHDRYRGGSVMIWGGIWNNCKTAAVIIQSNMNSKIFVFLSQIISLIVIPILQPHNLIFQQDNDHTLHVL